VGLAILLVCTAVLYLWNLSAGGYGNTFYAAAAQAGAQNWSAWFFGALDAQDFITVDKPPGALWITGLSVRLFGMNSLAVLVPQALMGVAAVAVLFATVRRAVPDREEGVVAGLIAGGILAFTPAAALLFRFNNPDALLILLLTVAAYCATRAVQVASWRWLAVVGVVVGAAFLTKMFQAFLVLPGFAAAYLLLAQTSWRNRVLHLAAATAALIASAGWWVLIVQLIPAQSRPYIAGSTDNTVLDLALGYNGLYRILGAEHGSASAGSALESMDDATGPWRLFTSEMAVDISWFLPVALFAIGFGAYCWARGRLDTDGRAALVTWGGWLLVTGAVFSFMHGIVHAYYTVALAPAVGALVGLGAVWAWRERDALDGRIAMACMLGLAGVWSALLLQDNHFGPHWLPWALASVCCGAALVVLIARGRWTLPSVSVGAAAATVGTLTVSVAIAASLSQGPVPTAFGRWTGGQSFRQVGTLLAATHTPWSAAINGSLSAAALEIVSGTSVMAIGGWRDDPVPTLDQFIDDVKEGKIAYYVRASNGGVTKPPSRAVHPEAGGSSNILDIADWVAEHYTAVPIGRSLVYYRLT
jgi:4-amino-4-deoxy-L-arabinose transferase-like glycosyltransferase